MNQLLPYEKQLAAQMQLAPVPDMQDAVWAKIEAMLDAEIIILEDKHEEIHTKNNKKNYTKHTLSIAIIILAVIIAVIINRKQRNSKLQKPKLEVTVPVNQKNSTENNKSLPYEPVLPPPLKQKSRKDKTSGFLTNVDDSAFIIPPLPQNNPVQKSHDSIIIANPSPAAFPQKDSLKKKPRGVSGISDSDYRFVMPKKDSTN